MEERHALALFYLLAPRGQNLRRATEILEELARDEPGNVEILNDLGVAQVLLALSQERSALLSGAFSSFQRAQALASEGPVEDNHEWLLQQLGPGEFQAAYVGAVQGATPFELAERFDELLRAWVGALGREDAAAASAARESAATVAASLQRRGDPWAADVVVALDDSLAAGRRAEAVAAFGVFRQAELRLAGRNYSAAAVDFAAVESAVLEHLGPFVLELQRQRFLALYFLARYSEALEAFQSVLDPETAVYPYRHADALRLAALVSSIRGEHGTALQIWEDALYYAQLSGEVSLVVAIYRSMADTLHLIQRGEEAWEHFFHALELGSEIDSNLTLYALYQAGAAMALDDDNADFALFFSERSVEVAQLLRQEDAPGGTSVAALQAGARRFRALALHLDGSFAEGLEEIGTARQALQAEGVEASTGTEADLDLAEATILVDADELAALSLLDRVAARFDERQYGALKPRAILLRAKALRNLEQYEEAEAALAEGLAEVDRQEADLHTDDRWVFHTLRQELVLELVKLRFSLGCERTLGLEAADRVYGQALQQWLASYGEGSVGAVDVEAMARALPPGDHLLHYLPLEDQLCIWSVREGVIELVEVPVSRARLREEVQGLLDALQPGSSAGAFLPYAEQLYEWLIRPLEGLLVPEEALRLVLSPELAQIPFSLLRDAETDTFLVQDFRHSVVPSLQFAYVMLQRQASRGPFEVRSALVVTAREGADRLGKRLDPLSGANEEGEDFLTSFLATPERSAVFLTDAESSQHPISGTPTLPAVLAALPSADLLYFTGHAVAPLGFPPRLILAPNASGDEQDLLPEHVLPEPGSPPSFGPRVVILSACETAVSLHEIDLPTAFLIAGADTVVANLWSVGDLSTADFTRDLTNHLFDVGLEPAEAL
ncbi:MAG: CHAT domain-containing protein, partial [Acidobacteriota bacterium]|nr:CHAT domain-containing protein [Acidobacteriota bacterium]